MVISKVTSNYQSVKIFFPELAKSIFPVFPDVIILHQYVGIASIAWGES